MLKTLYTTTALSIAALPALAGPDRFDAAEDHTRFVFASAPVFEDGMPAYGNAFITEGYIYPAGTLAGGVEGVNPDGSPAFPDLVLGTFTCDGYFVGDGMRTTEGPMVITRQVFRFENEDILVSHGPEFMAEGAVWDRVISGGTGEYAGVEGVLRQAFLGMSDGYGSRLEFEIVADQREARLLAE